LDNFPRPSTHKSIACQHFHPRSTLPLLVDGTWLMIAGLSWEVLKLPWKKTCICAFSATKQMANGILLGNGSCPAATYARFNHHAHTFSLIGYLVKAVRLFARGYLLLGLPIMFAHGGSKWTKLTLSTFGWEC
jgi:hypothetical protein